MIEKLRNEPLVEISVIPINERAKEGKYPDSEIFGITNDIPIVLDLFRKEGLVVPNSLSNTLRGGFIALLGQYVTNTPLYLH